MKHWEPQAAPVRRELCAPDREECTDQTPCAACPTTPPTHVLVEDDKWPEESAP